MQHLYPPTQHDSNAHSSASEIEAFRARQRMQFRYQQQHVNQQQQQQQVNHHQQLYEQHLRSLGVGNQVEERNEDDRVRKASRTKRLQQFQQQQVAPSRTTRLPNFGAESRHHQHHHHQHHHHQHMLDNDDDVASPVPHTMFNAFDYGTSPEAFAFTEQEQHNHDHHHSNNNDHHQQMQHDTSGDEKSIWRRRFASDDAHLRRSPKLGRVALWDSTCPLGYGGGNNQFSHLQAHNHCQQQQQ